VTMRT